MNNGKSPVTSKTLWVNLVAIFAMVAQSHTDFVIGPEYQAAILGVINLILRIVTKEKIDWNAPAGNSGGWISAWSLPWLLVGCILVASLTACVGPNALIKIDGKVDQIEAALIQTAVGVALTAKPEAVPPAYAVSTAILARIDGDSVLLSGLDAAVAAEVDKLDLLDAERASVMDLVGFVRAQIVGQLSASGVADPNSRLIVVRQVIEIVRNSAAARLGVSEWPDATTPIDWIAFERIVDQAIEQAAAATDSRLGVNSYQAKLRSALRSTRANLMNSRGY